MPNILTDADKALENCRLYAARHRNEEWAKTILRFCAEAGVTGSPLRALPTQVEQKAVGEVKMMRQGGNTGIACYVDWGDDGMPPAGSKLYAGPAAPVTVEQMAVAWQYRRYHDEPLDPGWGLWHPCRPDEAEAMKGRDGYEVRALGVIASPTPAAPAAPEQGWTSASSPPPDGVPVLVRWPNSNPEADAPWRYAVARYEAKRAIHHWWSAESGVPRSFVVAPSDWRAIK